MFQVFFTGPDDADGCCSTSQIFTKRIKEGVWDVTAVVDSGGMPSSHSALCMARTLALPPNRHIAVVGHVMGCMEESALHCECAVPIRPEYSPSRIVLHS